MKLAVHVIQNQLATRTSEETSEKIVMSFGRHSHVTCQAHVCHPDAVSESIFKALDLGADIICAAGGDGTVSLVANHLVGKEVPLGILPLGSLNHLAKDLGIPLDVDAAVDAVCSGKTTAIDVGEVNGVYFVNNVNVGMYPKMVRLRDRLRSYIGKWPAMFIASVVVLVRISQLRVQIEWNNHVIRRFVPLLFIGNNAYETSWPDIGTRQALTKGVLWLMLIKSKGILSKLKAVLLGLVGRVGEAQEVEIFETTNLVVSSARRSLIIGIDGETVKLHSPLVFRSHPVALNVRIPAVNPRYNL